MQFQRICRGWGRRILKCWSCGKEMWKNENNFHVCPDLTCQIRTQEMVAQLSRMEELRTHGFKPEKGDEDEKWTPDRFIRSNVRVRVSVRTQVSYGWSVVVAFAEPKRGKKEMKPGNIPIAQLEQIVNETIAMNPVVFWRLAQIWILCVVRVTVTSWTVGVCAAKPPRRCVSVWRLNRSF